MKRGAIWIIVICLMVTSLVLASCSTTSSTSAVTSTPQSTPTSTITSKPRRQPLRHVVTPATTTTTAATTGNWWDSLGKPQYGGTITMRYNKDPVNFDPYNVASLGSIEFAYYEKMFADDWTLDQSIIG